MAKFIVNTAMVKRVNESKQSAYAKQVKENCIKNPEKYLDIIPKTELPIKLTEKGSQVKLVFSVSRNNDDIVNEVMLDIRKFVKKAGEEDFIPTKSGIRIPLKYGEQLAGTIQEIIDEVTEAKVSF